MTFIDLEKVQDTKGKGMISLLEIVSNVIYLWTPP